MTGGHPLDNPIWTALTTRHRALALGTGAVRRYPAAFGPFVAVEDPSVAANRELDELVARGESVDVVGVAPAFPREWDLLEQARILQMVCAQPVAIAAAAAPTWRELANDDRAAMLGLTALVYPGYFRERTNEMGRYLGIEHDGVLAALAGERMATPEYIEVSGVCTHPDFLGRGYAGFLVSLLVNDIIERGLTPFLHVSEHNPRAIAVYERLGFTTRARLDLWLVRRP